MMVYVTAQNTAAHAVLLNEMYRARAAMFSDRLDWAVSVDEAGYEKDRYDALDPHYLIVTDEAGHHQGSLRLLPTTGETMLGDRFTALFDGEEIASPAIWECTRLCVGADVDDVEAVLRELMVGLCDYALKNNIARVSGLFDERTLTACRKVGWSPAVLGKSGRGDTAVFLAMWEVSEGAVLSMPSRRREQASLRNAS